MSGAGGRPGGELADLSSAMAAHVSECKATYKDDVLFGRRCLAHVSLWYEPKDGIYYRFEEPGRIPAAFITSTKLGFYVDTGSTQDPMELKEYFRDSYEGWYIQSKYFGHKKPVGVTLQSSRYRQCDVGLALNSQSERLVMKQLGK